MAFSTSKMPATRTRVGGTRTHVQLRRVKYTPKAVVEELKDGTKVATKAKSRWPVKQLDVASIRPADGFDKYEGHTLMAASSPEVPSQITRYGELCQMTYSAYLPIDASIPPYAPGPDIPQRLPKTARPLSDAEIAAERELRDTSLDEMRFMAPHPVGEQLPAWFVKDGTTSGALCYDPKKLPADAGFLEPDSPLVAGGYKVSHFFRGVAAVLDRAVREGRRIPRNWIGYIAHSEDLKEVVVVFRGTILGTEWSQNADCRAYKIYDAMSKAEFKSSDDPYKVLAHNGFGEVYHYSLKPADESKIEVDPALREDRSLSEQVLKSLSELFNPESPKYLGWTPEKLTITGHSLGGALATMAAFDIAHAVEPAHEDPDVPTWETSPLEVQRKSYFASVLKKGWPEISKPGSIQGVTWAQPRVGNDAYYKEFHRLVPRASWLRLVNKGDVVPMVPLDDAALVPEIGDMVFYWNYYAKKEITWNKMHAWRTDFFGTLFSPFRQIGFVLTEFMNDLKKSDKLKATYKHVGWELRFDPNDAERFPYLFMGLKDAKPEGTVKIPFLDLTLMTDLKSLAGRRHNLEVMMHMVDPTLDKARLNRTDNTILRYNDLKKNPNYVTGDFENKYREVYERLGDSPPACWWWPYQHTVGSKEAQKKLVLKQFPDGSYKWAKQQ